MILIIGLGNPEEKYKNTPHNLGFKIIDLLKERLDFPEFSLKEDSLFSKKDQLILAKPQTYMNESGRAVRELVNFYKIEPKNLWVIQDENDLDLGKFKISKDISAKGHNGLKSIIEKTGTQSFVRFRIGINNDRKGDLIDYVLKPFSKEEQELVDDVSEKVVDTIDEALQNGIEQTMLKIK